MHDFVTSGALGPYLSALVGLIVDEELRCWNAVLASRARAKHGTIACHGGVWKGGYEAIRSPSR